MERKCTRGFLVCLALIGLAVPVYAQDECTTAVAPGTSVDVCAMTANVATDPFPTCGSGGGTLTGWYEFTATDTTARLRTDLNSIATDSTFALYDACPPGGTELACAEDIGPGNYLGDVSLDGLTVGNTYYVIMMAWQDVYCGPFTLDVIQPVPGKDCGDGIRSTIPGDEECDGADDDACALYCLGDCTCEAVPVPTLPEWGLLGLAALLLGGGAVVFGRLRG